MGPASTPTSHVEALRMQVLRAFDEGHRMGAIFGGAFGFAIGAACVAAAWAFL